MALIRDELFRTYNEIKRMFSDNTVGYFVKDKKEIFTISMTGNNIKKVNDYGDIEQDCLYLDFNYKTNFMLGIREISTDELPTIRYKENMYDSKTNGTVLSLCEVEEKFPQFSKFVKIAIDKIPNAENRLKELEMDYYVEEPEDEDLKNDEIDEMEVSCIDLPEEKDELEMDL